MDAAELAERRAFEARLYELRVRAAEARRAAQGNRRRSEQACARAAAVLSGFKSRPFGDRGERFFLRVARSRPLVGLVRHDLGRWLEQTEVPAEVLSEVVLACSEACANAVEHPRESGRQLVEVEAAVAGSELELRVRDFGVWKEQPGSPLRGRGLDMIRDLMDSLDVQRTQEGTEVVMRRSFAS